MAATTVNFASSFTAGVYTSSEVSADTNKRVTIPVTWSNLNGYPELVVEMLPDGTVSPSDKNYFPVKVPDDVGFLRPIKLRMIDTSGEELLLVESINGTSPYVRVVIYANQCDEGTLDFEIDAG